MELLVTDTNSHQTHSMNWACHHRWSADRQRCLSGELCFGQSVRESLSDLCTTGLPARRLCSGSSLSVLLSCQITGRSLGLPLDGWAQPTVPDWAWRLSLYPSIHPSICPSVHPSTHISISIGRALQPGCPFPSPGGDSLLRWCWGWEGSWRSDGVIRLSFFLFFFFFSFYPSNMFESQV